MIDREAEFRQPPQVRSLQEIGQSLHDLEPVFSAAWDQRFTRSAEPVPLPAATSGYGLPVRIGLREIRGGYVYGLFEDRSGVSLSPAVEPIGQLIVQQDEDACLKVLSAQIVETEPLPFPPGKDKYFSPLINRYHEFAGVAVGFEVSYAQKREDAAKRMGMEHMLSDRPGLDKWVHARQGLGTILLDMLMLLTSQTGQTEVAIEGCNELSSALVRASGYTILEVHENPQQAMKTDNYTDFRLEVPVVS